MACWRTWVVGLALAAHCLVTLGLHLPLPTPKDLSKPFPCMHSRCGCLSAKQCWDSCCCRSDKEKLAWAIDNNVEPDPGVVQRVALAARSAVAHDHDCCRAVPSSSGDVAAAIVEATRSGNDAWPCSECRDEPQPLAPRTAAQPGETEPIRVGEVVLSDALRCSGMQYELFASGPAILLENAVPIVPASPIGASPLGDFAPPTFERPFPPTPPPEGRFFAFPRVC